VKFAQRSTEDSNDSFRTPGFECPDQKVCDISQDWLPRIAASRKLRRRFKNDIRGVLSDFDRVLFRGSLRRLTHSLGMKWYLGQNDISLQTVRRPCESGEPEVKKAALAPFQEQNLLVR